MSLASLVTDGYAVLQYTADAAQLQKEFDEILNSMPDQQLSEPPYSIGGFGALGNAYSFHHAGIRHLRRDCYELLKPLLAQHFQHKYIELLVDRITYRQQKLQKPGSESYHRDLTPAKMCHKSDRIFGGFLNCNATESQHFICVPATHTQVSNHSKGLGFATLTPQQRQQIAAAGSERRVAVPAGHVLLFDQRLVHAVNPGTLHFDLRRKHMNIRLTNHRAPLIKNIGELLAEGAVIPLKSGQMPSLYPDSYDCNWQDKLVQVSKKYPDCLKHRRMVKGKRMVKVGLEEKEYLVLLKHCPSLQELDIGFQPYTPTELALYVPHALH